jgi:hypothetical protein
MFRGVECILEYNTQTIARAVILGGATHFNTATFSREIMEVALALNVGLQTLESKSI